MNDKVKQAKDLYNSGQQKQALELLKTTLIQDPHNETAWKTFIDFLPNKQSKIKALRRNLEYNPNATWAYSQLDHINTKRKMGERKITGCLKFFLILGTIGVTMIGVFIALWIVNTDSRDRPVQIYPTQPRPDTSNYSGGYSASDSDLSSADAWCKVYVENELRNPRSADFPWYDKESVTYLGAGRYKVFSYVTAENGFGGLSTAYYECIVKDVGDDYWPLESLIIE